MKKRILKEITLMNAILCFSVIMIHLTSSPLGALEIGSAAHGVVFFLNKILSFSVPAFIFLSGFKLQGKYKDGPVELKGFFLGRLLKIVVPYIISVTIYFLYFWQKGWVLVSDLPEYFLLGTLVAHFYYVIIAVQLYLLFPLLSLIFRKYPLPLTALAFVSTFVFNGVLSFKYSDRFFGAYIFYFVLGMVFAKYKPFDRIKYSGATSILAFVLSGVVHLGYSYITTLKGAWYEYEGIGGIVYSITAIAAIYYICLKISDHLDPIHKFASAVSSTSYYIYLYHILLIFILQYDVYPRFSLSVSEEFLISCVVVFGAAVVYAILWPKIRNRITKKRKQ